MKLAVAVQRYGADINGGAELHARYIAERLAPHAERRGGHHLRPRLRDLAQRAARRASRPSTASRCAASRSTHERNPLDFGRRSEQVFNHVHSIADELAWLKSEGPASRGDGRLPGVDGASTSSFLFSYRYYHAYHAARRLAAKAILVPTAERDPAVGLGIFGPVFRSVRAIMYNSHEERAMIQAAAGNADVPGVVVGVGSEVPAQRRRAALPPQVQDRPAVCDLHRPHRREQGLQGAVRVLPPLRGDVPARDRSGAGRQRDHAGARPSAHPSPRLRLRRGQVRRAWRPRTCSSCRPTSRACRWSRSRPGRWASRSSPTADATC